MIVSLVKGIVHANENPVFIYSKPFFFCGTQRKYFEEKKKS